MSDNTVVRLSVNLAPDVADALRGTAAAQGITVTEAVRRAVAVWKLVSDENAAGRRLMVVDGKGDGATFREVVLLGGQS